MNERQISALAAMFSYEHTYDGSQVGPEAVPVDDPTIANKLKEERDWRPYCLMCSTARRMDRMVYGFRCSGCRNTIGWDCKHLDVDA